MTHHQRKIHNSDRESTKSKADVDIPQITQNAPYPSASSEQILHLQRTIGNQAVQRLIGNNNSSRPLIQRCNGNPNCTCPRCTAKRNAEMAKQNEDELVQRAIGDGHDLTAAPIAGDSQLEDAYDKDKTKYVRFNAKGVAVTKVQSALLQLGYQLPKFGPDGHYGSETRKAVVKFQQDKGIGDDGTVGPETLTELDKALKGAGPAPKAIPGTIPTGPNDFKIDDVRQSNQSKIFFERDKATLVSKTGADKAIKDIKKSAPAAVKLIGFASAEEDPAIAIKRAKAVEAALGLAPHTVKVSSAVGNPDATKSSKDFAGVRSVEVLVGNAKPQTQDCSAKFDKGPNKGKLKNPPKQPCPDMDIDTWNHFNKVLPIAKDSTKRAVDAVNPKSATFNKKLVEKFFGDASPATTAKLMVNFQNLKKHVDDLPKSTECGGQCDKGLCDNGAIAYNSDVDAASRMTLCVPTFKSLHENDAARNLIHESAHGTSPLGGGPKKGTTDVAYRHERMMFHLSPKERQQNSDSYALFALFVRETEVKKDPDAVPAGIATPADTKLVGFDPKKPDEADAVNLAVAKLEKRLTWSKDHVGQMYGELLDVKDGKQTWAQSWAESMMHQAASRFPLTRPPTKPTLDDQAKVAAILDRYNHMYRSVKRDLKIARVAAGTVVWLPQGDKAADNFTVGPDFFKASADNQISLLVEALVLATPDAEKQFIPSYVSFARWIHENAES